MRLGGGSASFEARTEPGREQRPTTPEVPARDPCRRLQRDPPVVRILIVTGIYPPDIGGPATHSDDVRWVLTARGHDVRVLTLTDDPRPRLRGPLVQFPRRWPWPARMAAALAWTARLARNSDVVYATGLDVSAVGGARAAGTPVVLKVVGDPAWERGVREGLTARSFDDFQDDEGGPPKLRAMRAVRNWSARHATALLSPSPHLAARAGRWARRNDVGVIPNGVRGVASTEPTDGASDLQLVFVGRLVAHKHVEKIIAAVAQSDRTHLDIVGDGPEHDAWSTLADELGVRARVQFHGSLDRNATMTRIADADALVLASGYEGLPHVVLEALACGTPVVTTPHHGLDDVLTDGHDALLVEGNVESFATAFTRLATDERAADAPERGRPHEWSRVDDRPHRRSARGALQRAHRSPSACGVPGQERHARASDPRRRAEVRDQRATRELVRGVRRAARRAAPTCGCERAGTPATASGPARLLPCSMPRARSWRCAPRPAAHRPPSCARARSRHSA